MELLPLTSNCTSKSFFNKNTLNAQAAVHLNRENEDRIRERFYSAFLNRSSIKMLAINQKSLKKKKIFFFFLLFTNKKTWGGPFFVGAGGDENLKINFLWPNIEFSVKS